LLVEERAISSDQRGDYLLVVNGENKVEYRPVRLGIHVGELRAIESGIKADDWVVVNGLQRARPGSVVKPEPAKGATEVAARTDSTPKIKMDSKPQSNIAPQRPEEKNTGPSPQPAQTQNTKSSAPHTTQ
jgi:hypothetical protein